MVALCSCLAIGVLVGCWGLHGEWNVKSVFQWSVVGLNSSITIRFLNKKNHWACAYPKISIILGFYLVLINCVQLL